jgi:hypothetical protein
VTESPATNHTPVSKNDTTAENEASSGINWADPNVPAGNAPPLPLWPLVLSIVVFSAWIIFLVAMAVIRIRTTAH